MSSLVIKPLVQHHLSRVRPIQLRDLPLHQWGNLPVKDPTQQVCMERQNVLNAVGVGETLENTGHEAQVHSYVIDVLISLYTS